MPRTREQWNAEIATYATSNGVSTSSSADWLWLRDLCVTIAILIEGIIEIFKSDIDDKLTNKHAGTYRNLPNVIRAFQLGHDLVTVNGTLGYAEIDTDAQIVTQVSVKKQLGQVNIKAAKDDGAGNTIQLSTAENTALYNYIDEFIAPGTDWALASLPRDVIKYVLNIEYDTTYDETALLANVDAALTAFRLAFGFNSMFYKSALISKVKSVPGVLSATGTISMSLNNDTETIADVIEKQELPAGYFLWDDTSSITTTPA